MKLEIVFTVREQGFSLTKISCLRQIRGLGLVFPSPDKLLLAERRVLEAELSNIKAESHHQFNPNHPWAKTIEYDSNNCNK